MASGQDDFPLVSRRDDERKWSVISQDIHSNMRLRAGMVHVPQINIEGVQYVTLPAAFLDKCGYRVHSDLMLYCRHQVRDLWSFVPDEVVAKSGRGFIPGPSDTGKSVSTLSFMASLDHHEWNVVWIHLRNIRISCLALGSKTYWLLDDRSTVDLPRVAGSKVFICVNGYKAVDDHKAFLRRIYARLVEEDIDTLNAVLTVNLGSKPVSSWLQLLQ